MPVLQRCSNCGREGGFAENEEDKVCFRCKKKLKDSRQSGHKEEHHKEEEKK